MSLCVWEREEKRGSNRKKEGERLNEKFGSQQCFSIIGPALKASYISFPTLKSLVLDLTP